MPVELKKMDTAVSQFICCLSKGDNDSSYSLAVKTTELVKSLVESDSWDNADSLIKNIKSVYQRLEDDLPHCHVAHNVIKYETTYHVASVWSVSCFYQENSQVD